jgi:hypothetical protein
MEKTFFLFGTEVCDVYSISGDANIIAYLIKGGNGDLVSFDSSSEHPNILLSKYDGWNEWVEISEHEYNLITSKL